MLNYFTAVIFFVLFVLYYFIPIGTFADYEILLTISTFLFSIFTGFFIAYQGKRYDSIRNQITNFDGEMSGMYRSFGHFNREAQNDAKKLLNTITITY